MTGADRVRDAAAGICNAVLIKPNQAGTVTEAKAALDATCAAEILKQTAVESGSLPCAAALGNRYRKLPLRLLRQAPSPRGGEGLAG